MPKIRKFFVYISVGIFFVYINQNRQALAILDSELRS